MPDFLNIFRTHADAAGRMPFDRFMALALYDAQCGYYRRDRVRVGRNTDADFFTASSSGPVFGELICAAAEKLLREKDAEARDYVFVEIGAEPGGENGGGVLSGVKHPFAAARTIRVGEPIAGNAALSGKCVVFSNELFDAQPFRRLVFRGGAWRELGVALDGEKLMEVELPHECELLLGDGINNVQENYHLDVPLRSVELVNKITSQPWSGLFLACDYGKSWRELTTATPAGTARAYYRHTQSNDLLARPGEQDLTCHICWDWLADALAQARFSAPQVESQEAFFVRHAGEYLAKAFAENAAAAQGSALQRKHALAQLLHPAHMGQKFQALHAFRA